MLMLESEVYLTVFCAEDGDDGGFLCHDKIGVPREGDSVVLIASRKGTREERKYKGRYAVNIARNWVSASICKNEG